MIVRHLDKCRDTERMIKTSNWDSTRMLLRGDKMGFSFHITRIYEGAELPMEYRNHLESVYCISGEGEIEDLSTGEVHPIKPGTIYALDKHDKHILRARKELELACVFNPALHGKEVHDATGAYPEEAEEVSG